MQVPEGWKIANIEECCDIRDKERVPLNSQERATMKGYYPYCGANGIQGYINDYIFDDDIILMAEDGSVGVSVGVVSVGVSHLKISSK